MTPQELNLELFSNADYEESIVFTRADGGSLAGYAFESEVKKTLDGSSLFNFTLIPVLSDEDKTLTLTLRALSADIATALTATENSATCHWDMLCDVGDGIKHPVYVGKAKVKRGVTVWG